MTSSQKTFSIVVPVYQNELNLPVTIPTLLDFQNRIGDLKLELVFVNDGSSDKSYEVLLDFQKKYPSTITVVNLVRNFGQDAATRAGLRFAKGDCVGIISADLQDPPELFLDMLKAWREKYPLVIGVREDREDRGVGVFYAKAARWMIHRFAVRNYPPEGFDFCLLDRVVVDEVCRSVERNTSIFVLLSLYGYRSYFVKYTRRQRDAGVSQWGFFKKIELLLDIFIGFTYLPVRIVSYAGILISIASFIFAGYVILSYFLYGSQYPGWASLMVVETMLGGLILVALGILGEYVWRLSHQVKERPLFLVESVHEVNDDRN